MSRLQDFERLADPLLQALEIASDLEDAQLLLLIKTATFVLGQRIAQRSLLDDAEDDFTSD